MNLKKIKELSVLAEYHISGEARTKLLEGLESVMNEQLATTSIINLSMLCGIGLNLNINSANYWKEIAIMTEKNLDKVNKVNCDTLSFIHRAFTFKFPYISQIFFENIEKRMLSFGENLNTFSVVNLTRGICLRKAESESVVKSLEELCIRRMQSFNPIDLGEIGLSLNYHYKFAKSDDFRQGFEKSCMNNVLKFKPNAVVNISKGIAIRGWYFEEFFNQIIQEYKSKMYLMNYVQLSNLAWALTEYEKGLELIFIEEMMKRRSVDQ